MKKKISNLLLLILVSTSIHAQVNCMIYDKKLQSKYKGGITDAAAHGFGNASGPFCTYKGEFEYGKKSGKGVYIYKDSLKYEGNFKDDLYDGYGELIYTNSKIKYVGNWSQGKMHEQGTMYYTKKTIYEGTWNNGKRHGHGKLSMPDKSIYEGSWQNDKRNGQGKQLYSDGSIYDGSWRDDTPDGKGTFTDKKKGISYIGYWKDGKRDGKGVQTLQIVGKERVLYWNENYVLTNEPARNSKEISRLVKSVKKIEEVYDGYWLNDKKNAQGSINYTLYNSKGNLTASYIGLWNNDLMNGSGVFEFIDKGKYDGNWKNGYREGVGTYTYPSARSRYWGKWKNNKYHGYGIMYRENGKIIEPNLWEDGKQKQKVDFVTVTESLNNSDNPENTTGISDGKIPNLQFASDSRLDDTNGNQIINADESVVLFLTVTNKGTGTARRLNVSFFEKNSILGLTYPPSIQLQDIEPQGSAIIKFPINASTKLQAGEASFEIKIKDALGIEKSQIITIPTQEFQPPKLELHDIALFSSGLDGYSIEDTVMVNGTATLRIRIKNSGNSTAENVKIRIKYPTDFLNINNVEEIHIGSLNAGATSSDNIFKFLPTKNNSQATISISVSEKYMKFGFIEQKTYSFSAERKDQVIISSGNSQKNWKQYVYNDSDVDKNIPTTNFTNKNAFAVIIGNRNYVNERVANVEFAINDANSIKQYLMQSVGVPQDNIIFISDANKEFFTNTFGSSTEFQGEISKRINAESELFVYYSGHGAPASDNNVYLLPTTADPTNIGNSGYSLSLLYDRLSNLEAKHVTVFLDACFSGQQGIDWKSSLVRRKTVDASIPKNLTVFTAGGKDEVALWNEKQFHGEFTYALLKSIQKYNDLDLDSDKLISYNELFEGLNKIVKESTKNKQNPTVKGINSKTIINMKIMK